MNPVSTSKSLATRAGSVTVSPGAGVWTEFEVRDVDDKVRIMARKDDLTVSDEAHHAGTRSGNYARRESEKEKNKKKGQEAELRLPPPEESSTVLWRSESVPALSGFIPALIRLRKIPL